MEENNNVNENIVDHEVTNNGTIGSNNSSISDIKTKDLKLGKFKIPYKLLIIIGIVIALFFASIFVYKNFVVEPEVENITVSSIEEIIEIDELSTLTYYYNAIANKQDDDGNDLYHVAYEGHVTAGIDFDSISVDVDEVNKIITIQLPDAKIIENVVDPGSLDFIFIKKSAETETISTEGYQLAKQDLISRTANDETILKVARDNAVEAINALLEPWLKEADAEYTYMVK